MKSINAQGISYFEKLDSTSLWYWGTDYIHGDLYEAEELYQNNYSIKSNKLLIVRYPSGEIVEPIEPQDGCYFGRPIFYENHIVILLVDFNHQQIRLEKYDDKLVTTSLITALPLSSAKNCYNLMLHTAPLMLTRQGDEGKFEIIYPQKLEIEIGDNESFSFRKDDKLYFSAWFEDPSYREEVIIRDIHTGKIMERKPGGNKNYA